jgi:hypothetical protein
MVSSAVAGDIFVLLRPVRRGFRVRAGVTYRLQLS